MAPLSPSDISPKVGDFVSKSRLYCTILKEQLMLKKNPALPMQLSCALKKLETAKGVSLREVLNDSGSGHAAETEDKRNGKVDGDIPMLYRDLGWKEPQNFFYVIRPGDYSPLSPDADVVERGGRIGLDFWRWNRDRAPLGYTPPLCTCKRTAEPRVMLQRYALGQSDPVERRVCDNDVCRGLLYIPYSLLEVPLNRTISNGSEFARQVDVPNDTDVYCGSMKHTLVLCTTSAEHEVACLDAIRKSNVLDTLIYDVEPSGFIPYFKKRSDSISLAPLMTVEPIDSDVSDSEENYGFGEAFAVKYGDNGIVIHKYDPTNQEISHVDDAMMRCWMGSEGSGSEPRSQEPVTALKDYVLCELIESFSNERRPLTLSLRGGYIFGRYQEDSRPNLHLESPPHRGRKRRLVETEEHKRLRRELMERAHMHSIMNAIENITS